MVFRGLWLTLNLYGKTDENLFTHCMKKTSVALIETFFLICIKGKRAWVGEGRLVWCASSFSSF